jgi:uncharacterized protein (DUF2236 family)
VHVTLVHVFLGTYAQFVGDLTPEERDRYCAEAARIEPLLGIPAGTLPRSFADLERELEATLSGGDIAVTEAALTLAREILHPPVPLVARPVTALARVVTAAFLPPAIRKAYGLPWGEGRARVFRLAGIFSRAILPLTPRLVRHWPSARRAAGRGARA